MGCRGFEAESGKLIQNFEFAKEGPEKATEGREEKGKEEKGEQLLIDREEAEEEERRKEFA